MKIAVWRTASDSRVNDGTGDLHWGPVGEDGSLIDAGARLAKSVPTLRDALSQEGLRRLRALAATAARDATLAEVALAPPIPPAAKILCVGVNYPERNAEYRDASGQPEFPSLFVRFPSSFVGCEQPILRPPESPQLDYEGEIVIVIGERGRRIPCESAHRHIAAVTLMNEGSIRDWLRHGKFNVTQGKNFDRSGSIGPWLVTSDAVPSFEAMSLTTRVNGEERQRGDTGTLMFSFARIVEYVSTFMTLEPGDMIATGTPPGAGARLDPPRWLVPGDIVEVESPQVGLLRNRIADETP